MNQMNMDHTRIVKKSKDKYRLLSCLLMAVLFAVIIFFSFLGMGTIYGASPEWNGGTATGFAGGTGTETNPYLISTGEQLAYFSGQVTAGNTYEGKYIRLTQDILLNQMNADGTFVGSPRQFIAIGNANNPFKGHFDGAGYEIIGLYINKNGVSYQGLFGYADSDSKIRNLMISGSIAGGDRTGGVAGYTNGLITECIVSCPVTCHWKDYHGGIVGYAEADSVISHCTVLSNVEGREYTGGIAGYTKGKIIESNVGAAVAGLMNTGGIVGYAAGTSSEINNCSFSGTVEGTGNNYIGGIAGQLDGLITGCTVVDATITSSNAFVGGIVGKANTESVINNSTFSGSISGIARVGGIAGYTDGEITICINTGDVHGTSGVTGGIAGEAGSNSNINNCFNSGTIEGGTAYSQGEGKIGGIIGLVSSSARVHYNLNMGKVKGKNNYLLGGIVGFIEGSEMSWQNNFYFNDYPDAPTGTNKGYDPKKDALDIGDGFGAVPVGENQTWEDIQDLLNTDNDAGNDIWNQDMDDGGIPKPGGGGGSSSDPAFNIESTLLKEGKHYSAAQLGTSTSATITLDSIFTVFFCLEYTANSAPEGHTLKLKNVDNNTAASFPASTSVIMWAEAEDSPGNPYYYINLTEGADMLTLGDFIKMGSLNNDDSYSPTPVEVGDEKQYLFIFDFSKTAPGNQIPAGSYNIEFSHLSGGHTGTPPVVTVAGKNDYSLAVTNDGAALVANSFTISLDFSKTSSPVSGYDYKTDGKMFALEFYLEREGAGGTGGVREPLPIGTKIIRYSEGISEGITEFISSTRPYLFLPLNTLDPEQQQSTVTFTLDMSECVNPLAPGGYTLKAAAYACTDTDPQNPRGGYLLTEAEGQEEITLVEPVIYAIKADIKAGQGNRKFDRVFDRSLDSIPSGSTGSTNVIPVKFDIETSPSTLEPNSIEATLQRKYGKVYVNLHMDGLENPVTISNNEAVFNVPANCSKGTYRFVFVLYDEDGTARAETVKNIIIR